MKIVDPKTRLAQINEDRIALEHERPLGIRGLADRWGWKHVGACFITATTTDTDVLHLYADRGWLEYEGEGYWVPTAQAILDDYELSALLGWVRRRMAREVEARRRRPTPAAAGGWPDEDDNTDDRDLEALSHAVAQDLGGDFTADPHGEHGLAWALCEQAGWPS